MKIDQLRGRFGEQRCEEAEAFALDPANALYQGDVAHLCEKCGYWHLSGFEWLDGPLPETTVLDFLW